MPDDQKIAAFTAAVHAAGADMTPDERAAVLGGLYAEASVTARGPRRAAEECYLLSLELARRAGIKPAKFSS
jgi:hypothetical protein